METSNVDQHRFVDALEELDVHDHLCLIYESRKQQFAAIIPFLKIGLGRGEKCVYIADDNTSEEVLAAMREAGIDVDGALTTGALSVITKQEAYLKEGFFDPDWMIRFLQEATEDAKRAGFAALRATGEMTWVLGNEPGVERLLEYEAKLNYFFPEYDCLAVCQYNRKRFSGEIIRDVIRTHPTVIYGMTVCDNAYFVPPDEFLGPESERGSAEVDRLLANIVETERDKRQILQSDARLRRAQKTAHVGNWEWDLRTNELRWSEENYRIFDIPSDTAPSVETFIEYVHPDDKAAVEEAIGRALEGSQPYDIDMRIIRGDGIERIVNAKADVEFDEAGKAVTMTGTVQDVTDRVQASRALIDSEARYRSLFEQSMDGALLGIPDGTILAANPAMCAMVGRTEEDIRKIGRAGGIDESDPRLAPALEERARTGRSRADLRLVRSDGTKFEAEVTSAIFLDGAGEQRTATVIRDLTKRRRSEDALRESEEGYRLLAENMRDVVWLIDLRRDRILYVSPSVYELRGYTPEEVIAGSMEDSLTPRSREEVARWIAEEVDLVRHGRGNRAPQTHEVEQPCKDGSTVWTEVTASYVCDEDGEPVQIVGLSRDMTDRNKTENALRESEERFRSIFEQGAVGIVVADLDRRFVRANPTFCRMLGYEEEELVGKTIADITADEDTDASENRLGALFGGREDLLDLEKRYVRKDGELVWGHVSATVLRNADGETVGSVAAVEDITERKKAEQAVGESEARLRDITSSMADWVWEVDEDGVYTYSSATGSDLLGRPLESIIGKTPFDFMPPDEAKRVGTIFGEIAANKAPVDDLENWNIRGNGERICLLTNGVPILDEDGNLKGYRGVDKDITERKLAEDGLRAAGLYARSLIEASLDPLVTISSEGKITDVNRATEFATGLGRDDLIGTDFSDYFTEPNRAREGYEKAFAQGGVRDYPLAIRHKDGTVTDVLYNATVYRNQAGEVAGIFAAARDVTETKRVENALADSEKRYRRLVESSPDGIAIESKGKIVYANLAALMMLGASQTNRLLGTPYLDLVEPEYRDAVSRIIEEGSSLERVPAIETRLRSLQGRPIDVEAAFIPMSYEGMPAVHIVFRDITERKQIEQVKSDFIATVSHELRSPLAVILGFATFLEQNAGDASRREDTKRAARAVHDRGSFMKSLVESLLEMSHIQSGEFSLSLDNVDLGELLTAASRAVPLTDQHGLELEISSRIGPVVCDPRRLSIAVSNLVANAVKFSPQGGVVRVAAKRKAGRAIISVSDEGIGISTNDQAHIFDRFTQADMSSTRRFAGTGMGLYIARQIIEAHGGTLSVASKLGKGSTFTIDLPIAQEKPALGQLKSVAS